MDAREIEERFIDLETLAAEHERVIKDLNTIVAQQAQVIDLLNRQLRYLAENFDMSGAVKPLSEETPPPHY